MLDHRCQRLLSYHPYFVYRSILREIACQVVTMLLHQPGPQLKLPS